MPAPEVVAEEVARETAVAALLMVPEALLLLD